MEKEDLRDEAGFPASALPCFSTNSDRGEVKSQEVGSTASLSSAPASVPPPTPGLSPEVFLSMVHRMMEEQQQRHAEQQTVLTELYRELRQSVGGLRNEVQQIGVSLERLQRGKQASHGLHHHPSKTTTSSGEVRMEEEDEEEEGREAGGKPPPHHPHGSEVPPATLRTPRPESPPSFSKTMAGVTPSEGTHPGISGAPHDAHTLGDKPMKKGIEGEMGSAAMTTPDGHPGSGVEVETPQTTKKRPAEVEEEDIRSLSNVGPITPQRRPHLPSAAESGNSTLVSTHSSVPFDTPVGRRMPAGMRGVDHEEEVENWRGRPSGGGESGVVGPRPPPPFTPLQRGTEEKEDPMQLMKTPTAKVGTQHRAAAAAEEGEEEEELGRSILEEMSRELERDGHSHSSLFGSHSSPSTLPSYTPNEPTHHHTQNGSSGTSPASRNAEHSLHLATTHTSVSSGGSSGGSGGAMGGKPTPATTSTPASTAERGRGGTGGKAGFTESPSSTTAGGSAGAGGNASAARGVQRGSGGGGSGNNAEVGTHHPPTYTPNALSALEHQIQEASAHYNEIFEKIAASPLSAGWMPTGGGGGGVENGSGGAGSRASPTGFSSSSHSPPGVAGGGGGAVPSLWLEVASASPFLSGATPTPNRGNGPVSHTGSGGSHTSALLHTPTPTGRSATAMTTPSQGPPLSSPTPYANTSLHTMNQFGYSSSASQQQQPSPPQQLLGNHASNFMINSTTNSFVSLDPGTANASGIDMSSNMLGTRAMRMRSIHGDGGNLSPSYHSGTGGSMIGGGTNTSTSSGSVVGAMPQRKNSTSGIGMLSTDVSGMSAEEMSAMEMVQGLLELPCTNGISVTYMDDRPRVHAQAHSSTAPPPRRSPSQSSKPTTGTSSTQHPSESSSASTASSSMQGKKLSPTAHADGGMRGGPGRNGATEDGDAAGESRGISDSYASSAAPMTCVFAADRASPSTASTEDVSIMDEPENFGLPRHQPYHVLVEFKRHRTVQYESDAYVAPGKFVLVAADRGEDLGLVICTWYDDMSCTTPFPPSQPSPFPLSSSSSHSPFSSGVGSSALQPPFGLSTHPMTTMSPVDSDPANMLHGSPVHAVGSGANTSTMGVNVSHTMSNSSMNTSTSMMAAAPFPLHAIKGLRLHGAKLPNALRVSHGSVLRLANHSEISQLYMVQAELERRAMDVCQQRVLERKVPMVLVYAEYQYDCKKLTFFYEAQQRTDFRELVRDLYKSFRARIWMEPVEDSANF